MHDLEDEVWEVFQLKGDQVVFGLNIADGTRVERTEVAEFNHSVYEFSAFTLWKFYLLMAREAESDADNVSKQLISEPLPNRSVDKKKRYTLKKSKREDLLKYFRAIVAAYVFSCFALEAYVNFRIDEFKPMEIDYVAAEELTKKVRGEIVKIKENLIKDCSLEEKLFYILPYFLKKKNIDLEKVKDFQSDFGLIVLLRNALAHSDSKKIRSGQLENGKFKTPFFWNNLIPRFEKEQEKNTLRFHPASFVDEIIKYIESAYAKK